MEIKSSYTFILYLMLALMFLVHDSVASTKGFAEDYYYATASLKRSSFPENFIFGTSSSAYQYEGAVNEGGRGASIWDTYTQKYPNKIKDQSDGRIAADSYHRYKEDVQIMKDLGFDAYRFSISWSRLLPGGNLSTGINRQGIDYYDNLVNELLSKGVKPYVTLFHFDHPQSLIDAYGGFLSAQIIKDFTDYAEVCFKAFGDRVKHWITINAPSIFSIHGYTNSVYAPGRCSNWLPLNCTGGDSAIEPYLVSHHQLLAHAAAVKIYREKYQSKQRGKIGLVQGVDWAIPLTQSKADIDAASRINTFKLDWLMEPLNSGSYPIEMVHSVGERLPKFSKEQSNMVKNSFDFVGINYYSTAYAADTAECPNEEKKTHLTDFCAELMYERDGVPIGPRAASEWIYLYPQGIEEVLLYIKNKFNNPIMYIAENGYDDFNDRKESLKDQERIDCHIQHLSYVHSAILKGVDVRGYFAWSLLDNFEWSDGYTVRFGIVYVNFTDGLKRYPKDSAKWFKRFLHQESTSQ